MSNDFEESQEMKEQAYYYNKEIQRLKQQHRYDKKKMSVAMELIESQMGKTIEHKRQN